MTRLWPIANPEALELPCVVADDLGNRWHLWHDGDDGFDAYPICDTGEINEDAITMDYVLRFGQCRWDLTRVDHRAKAAGEFTCLKVSEGGKSSQGRVVQALYDAWLETDLRGVEDMHCAILCRMRAYDPTVTADEAFAALTWARSVTSG